MFKIVRIYARSVPHVYGHKRLNDDATENVKPHAFASLRKYATVQKFKGLNAPLSAIFRVEYLTPQTCLITWHLLSN